MKKTKPKKPKRIVLGVGYPWFMGTIIGKQVYNSVIRLYSKVSPKNVPLRLRRKISEFNKIRLVAEVIKD